MSAPVNSTPKELIKRNRSLLFVQPRHRLHAVVALIPTHSIHKFIGTIASRKIVWAFIRNYLETFLRHKQLITASIFHDGIEISFLQTPLTILWDKLLMVNYYTALYLFMNHDTSLYYYTRTSTQLIKPLVMILLFYRSSHSLAFCSCVR